MAAVLQPNLHEEQSKVMLANIDTMENAIPFINSNFGEDLSNVEVCLDFDDTIVATTDGNKLPAKVFTLDNYAKLNFLVDKLNELEGVLFGFAPWINKSVTKNFIDHIKSRGGLVRIITLNQHFCNESKFYNESFKKEIFEELGIEIIGLLYDPSNFEVAKGDFLSKNMVKENLIMIDDNHMMMTHMAHLIINKEANINRFIGLHIYWSPYYKLFNFTSPYKKYSGEPLNIDLYHVMPLDTANEKTYNLLKNQKENDEDSEEFFKLIYY